MINLPIHLVNEVRLSGPVCGWWMYPIERYLRKLKSYVRNHSRPESSIAKGYLAEECLIFCLRYLHDGVNKRSKNFNNRYEEVATDDKSPIFPKIGYPLGKRGEGKKGNMISLDFYLMNLAHRYVLFNCEDEQVQRYIEEHEDLMKNKSKDKHRKRWRQAQQHTSEFINWFREKEQAEKKPIPDALIYRETRKRTPGRKYKTSYEPIEHNIDPMEKVQNQKQIGGDELGNWRLVGRCAKRMKKPPESIVLIPDEFLLPFKAQMVTNTVSEVMKIFKEELSPEMLAVVAPLLADPLKVSKIANHLNNGQSSRGINEIGECQDDTNKDDGANYNDNCEGNYERNGNIEQGPKNHQDYLFKKELCT